MRPTFPLGLSSPAIRPFQAGFAAVLSACAALVAVAAVAYAGMHAADIAHGANERFMDRMFVHVLAPFFALPLAFILVCVFVVLALVRAAGLVTVGGLLPIVTAIALHADAEPSVWESVRDSATFLWPYAVVTWLFFWAIVRETQGAQEP